ncbi:MAG: hypothetical protein HKP57_08085 [Halobacteria archaeon]|nr:hypothetical protein [Halobacteria archaeon]
MAIIDALLFGFVALLLAFKVLLLAAATVLLVFSMSRRLRKHSPARRQATARTHRLDVLA